MAPALAKLGWRVTILLEDAPSNRKKIKDDCPGIECCYYPSGLGRLTERNLKNLLLRKLKPDVVWICAINIRNWVVRPHPKALLVAEHTELQSVIRNKGIRRFLDYIFEWGHLFCFDAHILASKYLLDVYEKRLRLIKKNAPTLYQTFAFREVNKQIKPDLLEMLQAKYPVRMKFMYMGSFWENYGFWDMLHAFQKLAETRKDFVFLMSGKGPEKEKGMAWLHQHRLSDKIHFLGYVEDADLPTYFSFVDTFIAPMRDTAQDKARCPSKLFLYIPFQKPIITCKIGEPWELLREKGCYYLPGDAESLYMQLTKLVETPNKKIDLNLRLHTWDYRAIEFSNWIKNILRIKDEKN